jgi:hypothetical protein
LQNPLTPEQQQAAVQQLQQVHLPEPTPIVHQPTLHATPAIIPHLQSIYGMFRVSIVFFSLLSQIKKAFFETMK